MIDFDRILFKRIVFNNHYVHYDTFGGETERYKFDYDITIYRGYTLKGPTWIVNAPNYTNRNHNLIELLVDTIEYATINFPQYFRLKDDLLRKDLWKKLG